MSRVGPLARVTADLLPADLGKPARLGWAREAHAEEIMAASALPLTSDEMVLLIERHVTCEFSRDWDGARETLSPGAYYDLLPFGIRLRGREAIEGAWRRRFALPAMTPAGEVATSIRVRDHDVVVCAEFAVGNGDGTTEVTAGLAIFTFADGLISSETAFNEKVLQRHMSPVFDGEFMRLPGVERF
jgi:hypothetical protein